MIKFETFEHGADIGIRGYGKTISEAFSNTLKAITVLIAEKKINWENVNLEKKIPIKIEAELLDELLVMFINKVLTLFYIEKILFFEFRGKIEKKKDKYILEGEILGEKYFTEKFGCGVEIKGATFTMAEVKKEKGLWIAQCVVDV
ncbi:MAG: Archease [Thermodesulfobacterium sp.]|uniref:Archease n=1 Tax=Candidatus Thermodesulfobacterium syntrophicum TaxID=3060442 RepID=A0AAE3TFS6_9BACT|nr:Archease [Candidatus Thermodesulfobacterium syntrophicum]